MAEASVQGLIELAVGAEMLLGIGGSDGESDYAWDVLSATAETAFLTAAEGERSKGDAVGLVKGTDAFGAAAFGGVDGEEVDAEAGDV